ncbi:DNA-binding transcriptional regulator, LysR family [Rhizobium mongolense subsp. loessense]|uniref:HTH-type transcriptional regulator TtuA n=1 Tax=Rhizobium mongolense subsp. loessense TaxID=158890 RepID=A0A1G4TC52_9HYPH|nr:LysR substrate-binding domain-containing protein [Rhizobium mongolense]SCW78888.1 DNA-binding transcriptional regulator, LysR family [Rhizobium mongolense subsp. loessense]
MLARLADKIIGGQAVLVSLRRKLPPLTGLTAFEAVARLGSFTKAARELGVTQAAVSRQIHLLEESLGFPLFRRLHRKIEATDKGRSLSAAATTAFNLLADTIAEIKRDESHEGLTISASVAFSHFWLLPKIASFSRKHPEIPLRIISQDNAVSLDGGDVDLAIRYGNGMWSDGRAELLFEDEIFPVCSPDYAEKLEGFADLQDLTRHPLISSDTEDPSWTGWDEWFAAFSIQAPRRPSGLRCSFYTEAIYAALNGQGIALGWKRLVQNLLDQKALVRLTEDSIATRNGYFVIEPSRSAKNARLAQFVEWLKHEARDCKGDR